MVNYQSGYKQNYQIYEDQTWSGRVDGVGYEGVDTAGAPAYRPWRPL